MANHNFFTVDLGATSGRTILACYDGAKMEMTEITRFENPILPLGGHLFWNLPHLYNEIIRGLTKVASQGIEIYYGSNSSCFFVCFLAFEHFYFGEYAQNIGKMFQNGIEPAVRYAEMLADEKEIIYRREYKLS